MIAGVIVMEVGVRLMLGNVWLVVFCDSSWLRVPPMFSVPQENRLLKLPLELMRELTSNGLREFR